MNKRWLWIVLTIMTIIFCLRISPEAYAGANDQPNYKVYLGFSPKDSLDGAVIAFIQPNSPAYKAELLPGDVILSVQGIGVSSWQGFREKILPTLIPYQSASFVVQRGGARIEKTVVPTGIIRLTVLNPEVNFIIPGVAEKTAEGPKNAVDALDKINVLQQVFINPQTGVIEIIGNYDNRFPTGPIPYLDLLKTALAFPQPSFSLDPAFSVEEYLAVPPAEFSIDRMYSLVFGHPALERDRQLLIRLSAKPFGVSPEEYVTVQNYFMLDDKGGTVPPDVIGIVEKAMRNMGYEQSAQAWRMLEGNSASDASAQALRILGGSPGMYPGSMRIQALYALLGSLGNKPERYIQVSAQGRMSEPELVAAMHKSLLPEWDKAGKQNALISTFQDMILSTVATRELAQTSRSFPIKVVPTDLDPTSQLHRILYAADYSLKSLGSYPELFGNVPAFISPTKFRGMLMQEGKVANVYSQVRFWLEPSKVSMQISDDRAVISFGEAEMKLLNAIMREGTLEKLESGELVANSAWDKYCNDFAVSYDTYAHVLPSLHELREAAKVIALARWINAEKIPIQLSGIAQEKWSPPSEIEGYWMIEFKVRTPEPGEKAISVIKPLRTFAGGVSFKSKHNWTKYTPMPQGETKLTSQLSLSAGLGHKAVQSAQGGNLEQARYLAELSAQAMNGSVSKLDLAKQNIVVPDVKPIPAAPANVQLQKEMLKKTYQQITTISQNTSGRAAADATLAQLNNLYDQVKSNPVAASDYLAKLQTGQLTLATATPVATGPIEAEPAPTLRCVDGSLGKQEFTPERREYLSQRLQETRDHLRNIDEAMRRIAELNARDVKQMDELTGTISDAYKKAVERIADVMTDGLVSWPQGKQDAAYNEAKTSLEKALGNLNNEISRRIGLKTTSLSAAEAKKVDEELQNLYAAQYRVKDLYARVNTTYDVGKGVDNGIRYTKGASELAGEKDFIEQTRQSVLQTVGIMLDHPEVKKALDRLKIFRKARVDIVSDTWTFGQYMIDYGIDIYAGYKLWEPLAEQLNNNIDANRKALLELRTKTQQDQAEAQCLEGLMAR